MEMINGFACKTITDVEFARRHINPTHPKDGPYGLNKPGAPEGAAGLGPAVTPEFQTGLGPAKPLRRPTDGTGQVLDVVS